MKLTDPTTKIALKNILFTTDFSPISETARHFAESIARRYGSKLIAAHVISPLETRMVPPEAWGASQQALDEAANLQMDSLDQQLGKLPHETVVCHGLVWDAISDLIVQKEADLIVMGTHGRSGLGRLLMGSTAEEVFRQAPCPVLTIGPKVSAAATAEAEFKHIVLATSLTADSPALLYALSLAQEFQALVTIVYVSQRKAPAPDELERIVEMQTRELHDLVEPADELWCSPEYVVRFGMPAPEILQVAAEKQADLIVLGVRPAEGHLDAATHTASAIAHSVVCGAHCPVLTVRGAPEQ